MVGMKREFGYVFFLHFHNYADRNGPHARIARQCSQLPAPSTSTRLPRLVYAESHVHRALPRARRGRLSEPRFPNSEKKTHAQNTYSQQRIRQQREQEEAQAAAESVAKSKEASPSDEAAAPVEQVAAGAAPTDKPTGGAVVAQQKREDSWLELGLTCAILAALLAGIGVILRVMMA